MRIIIEYRDGVPFATHSIEPEDAAAWRARFEDAASKTTRLADTAGDKRARQFADDLVDATRAAQMGSNASGRAAAPMGAAQTDAAAEKTATGEPTLPAASTGWQPPERLDQDMDAEGAAIHAGETAIEEVRKAIKGDRIRPPRAWSGVAGLARSIWRFPWRLARGHLGLASTFWGFGLGGTLVQGILAAFVLDAADGDTAIILSAILLLYLALAWTGIWKAANRYQGRTIWVRLAKAAVVLSVLALVLSLGTVLWAALTLMAAN